MRLGIIKHSLPSWLLIVVVKNTGHDFKGRSAGKGGFALWTHHLNSTTRDTAFVPTGCQTAPQDSVRLGAGVQWGTAYAYAASQGVTLVGGDTPQVGAAGGWILVRSCSFTQIAERVLTVMTGRRPLFLIAYARTRCRQSS